MPVVHRETVVDANRGYGKIIEIRNVSVLQPQGSHLVLHSL